MILEAKQFNALGALLDTEELLDYVQARQLVFA